MAADLTPADLRAATAAGIVSEAQAARLATLAHARAGRLDAMTPGEEPFTLFRGFNDVFVAVGVAILGGGVWALAFAVGFGAIWPQLVAVALAWALAELLTRRRRMVAPSLLLAVGVAAPAAGAAGSTAFTWLVESTDIGGFGDPQALISGARLVLLCGGLGGLAAALAFYLRFRLPFALFLAAGAAYAALMAATGGLDRLLAEQFLMGPRVVAPGLAPALTTFAFGLAAFALAMAFDLRDPHRVTRLSACAFWLHVVAAVALVNTVAAQLWALAPPLGPLALAAALLAIAAVALVIDRRSFLTAAGAWVWALLAQSLDAGADPVSTGVALALLGGAMVGLGVGWTGLRGRLMAALPDFPLKTSLPPWSAA